VNCEQASPATQHWRVSKEEPGTSVLPKTRFNRNSYARRFTRYRTECKLVLTVLGPEGYLRVHGRCFELSEAGLGAVTTSELKVGEMASVELSMTDSGEPIAVRLVVRHRMRYRHGCEFVGLLPEQRERIRKFCEDLQPSESE